MGRVIVAVIVIRMAMIVMGDMTLAVEGHEHKAP